MRITLLNPKRFSKIFTKVTGVSLDNVIYGICTDSRQCTDGDLYIAIKGDKVDGNLFIQEVKDAGAKSALVSKSNGLINDIQQIEVEDPVKTIGQIANIWRKQFNIPIVGITGSNGKTTTKDLLKHILESKFAVHATRGNFNTSIGVPLTLLLLQDSHEISIVEMGANQIGDIKYLCQVTEPTDGLITNIAPAHLEGFGTLENVAAEKSELFNYIENGKIFKNISDERIAAFTMKADPITYGCNAQCDFCADYYLDKDDNIILIINTNEINIQSRSLTFAKNILAAAAIANTFGIEWSEIQKRVLSFTPTYGRGVIIKYDNITVIDDTYNANYNSTVAAIEYLTNYPTDGRRVFVFGDMAELGGASKEYHQKIGELCNNNNIDAVFTLGKETELTNSVLKNIEQHPHFTSKEILAQELSTFIKSKDIILFKGSRSMEMEKIIQEVFKK